MERPEQPLFPNIHAVNVSRLEASAAVHRALYTKQRGAHLHMMFCWGAVPFPVTEQQDSQSFEHPEQKEFPVHCNTNLLWGLNTLFFLTAVWNMPCEYFPCHTAMAINKVDTYLTGKCYQLSQKMSQWKSHNAKNTKNWFCVQGYCQSLGSFREGKGVSSGSDPQVPCTSMAPRESIPQEQPQLERMGEKREAPWASLTACEITAQLRALLRRGAKWTLPVSFF